jgi:hypothetical protein
MELLERNCCRVSQEPLIDVFDFGKFVTPIPKLTIIS